MNNADKTMDKIVALCKGRGYVYPGSEIYGGLANTWDYGPLGVEFKNNVKKAWWKKFIQESKYNVGLDCAILMNPETWVASGHVGGFSDPLMDCKECKSRHRADKLIEDFAHEKGESMEYMDPITNEKYVPYCIEPSLGADRVALAFLVEAYDEEELEGGDTRVVMHLHPALAPIKAAVLPLSKKLDEGATAVYEQLSKKFNCEYDNAGSIGKRYRRQDEIGTPYCITYDFDSAEDNSVTVRDRDTMEQQRIKIDELEKFLEEKLEF